MPKATSRLLHVDATTSTGTVNNRQINQHNLALAVIPRRCPATRAVRTRRPRLDLDPQPRRPLTNPADDHGGQIQQASAHMRVGSISNRGSSTLAGVEHRQRRRAPVPRQGPTPPSDPKRPLKSTQLSCYSWRQTSGRVHNETRTSATVMSVAISFASIGISVSSASASLASACANGRMCLSSTVTMDSANVLNTTSFSIGGIFPNDQNWSAKSFGNKQISRCASFSEDVISFGSHVLVVRAIANYNTGNNFGGAVQNLDSARSSAGTC